MCSLNVIVIFIVIVIVIVIVIITVNVYFGQVMSPHHSDQMSQRSDDSRVALLGCSLDVFVVVFVFVIVVVVVIVILLVRSCLLITLITCLKGHKSLKVLYGSVFQQCLVVS